MKKARNKVLQELQLYQQLMSMEYMLLVAYGALFLTFEGSTLALAYYLRDLAIARVPVPWIISAIAIGVGAHIARTLYFRVKQRDSWKIKIIELTEPTAYKADFDYLRDKGYRAYQKQKTTRGLLRIWHSMHLFPSWIMIACCVILIFWLALLWTPLT